MKAIPIENRLKAISQNVDPRKSWFRLYTNSSSESTKALKLTYDSGMYVTTLPVEGLGLPELRVGSASFYGLKEIQTLVEALKNKQVQSIADILNYQIKQN